MKQRVYLFTLNCLLLCATASHGAIVEHIGSYNGWDSLSWNELSGLNDPNDSLAATEIDFIGDASDTCAYWADNGSYIFFRFRVNTATADLNTFTDTHSVLIDVDNYLYGTGFGTDSTSYQIDYGFTWDSKSSDLEGHGLEMSIPGTIGSTWGSTKITDLDGVNGKTAVDINGDITGRGYDGFIRSVDGQSTANFGDTTFVDFAVSWDYLETYTDLRKGQDWNVALATIANANDHNFLSGDIAAGQSPSSSLSSGWTQIAAVPEPAAASLIAVSGLLMLAGRRFLSR